MNFSKWLGKDASGVLVQSLSQRNKGNKWNKWNKRHSNLLDLPHHSFQAVPRVQTSPPAPLGHGSLPQKPILEKTFVPMDGAGLALTPVLASLDRPLCGPPNGNN